MRFFKFCEKLTLITFCFLHKVTVACRLTSYLIDLFWGKSCFNVFVLNVVQKAPKIRFCRYYQICMEFFWFFGWSFSAIRILNCGKSCTEVFRQKGAQKKFCGLYNKLIHWIFVIFYMKLQQPILWQYSCLAFLEQRGPIMGLNEDF